MSLEERAVELVRRLEHGDEGHRQWLRDVATPLILHALEETRREAVEPWHDGGFW